MKNMFELRFVILVLLYGSSSAAYHSDGGSLAMIYYHAMSLTPVELVYHVCFS